MVYHCMQKNPTSGGPAERLAVTPAEGAMEEIGFWVAAVLAAALVGMGKGRAELELPVGCESGVRRAPVALRDGKVRGHPLAVFRGEADPMQWQAQQLAAAARVLVADEPDAAQRQFQGFNHLKLQLGRGGLA